VDDFDAGKPYAIRIRQAAPADAGAIAALLRRAFVEFEPLYTPDAFAATVVPVAGVLARMDEGPLWVAERDSELLGTTGAVSVTDSILVRGMAVDPTARGLGIARRLLQRTEDYARHSGNSQLSLYTTPFLAEAIRLYQKSGFQFTGETARPHGTELLRMTKFLREI
jgi:GNAT superfamily N-acetyltransferase